jgi:hypothetical protein
MASEKAVPGSTARVAYDPHATDEPVPRDPVAAQLSASRRGGRVSVNVAVGVTGGCGAGSDVRFRRRQISTTSLRCPEDIATHPEVIAGSTSPSSAARIVTSRQANCSLRERADLPVTPERWFAPPVWR